MISPENSYELHQKQRKSIQKLAKNCKIQALTSKVATLLTFPTGLFLEQVELLSTGVGCRASIKVEDKAAAKGIFQVKDKLGVLVGR